MWSIKSLNYAWNFFLKQIDKSYTNSKRNIAISTELFYYLSNTLKSNNISTWERSFNENSCFISFNQLSSIYDRELFNNGLQLKAVNYCCIALFHSYLLESLIRYACTFSRDLTKKLSSQLGYFSSIRWLFHNQGTFPQ